MVIIEALGRNCFMCRPIKGADQQTNHVVLRTGKVLATTRAHLSYMELMVVLSFSGLRGVGHFVKRLLKRWFAHKSSHPKMPSLCECVCVCVLWCQVYYVLRRSHFTRAQARTRKRALSAHGHSRSLGAHRQTSSAECSFTLAARRAWSPSRVYLQRSDNGAATTAQRQWRRGKGAATTAQ